MSQLRSSSEKEYAKFLDSKGIQWVYEPMRFDLGFCTYTPDFYLPQYSCYIELVGTQAAYFKNRLKYDLFKKKYPKIQFKIVNKDNTEYVPAKPRKKADCIVVNIYLPDPMRQEIEIMANKKDICTAEMIRRLLDIAIERVSK